LFVARIRRIACDTIHAVAAFQSRVVRLAGIPLLNRILLRRPRETYHLSP
jgi:hypothetical protein